jgi:hypothetical protein
VLLPRQRSKLARGAKDKEHAMSQTLKTAIAVVGIDIGKNSFHIVGLDQRGAIALRQKWKFSGKYAHRLIKGGIGHNLPQEAPQAFAEAIVDVAEV